MQKLKIFRSDMMMCIVGITMLFILSGCVSTTSSTPQNLSINNLEGINSLSPNEQQTDSANSDIFANLFAEQRNNVQVQGTGVVTKILADDNEGDRHQRFIIMLPSGQTLLIAHNIDIAPRVEPLAIGDTVDFYGEYVYSNEGGLIHWTHKDPSGSHVDGYIICNGTTFDYAPTTTLGQTASPDISYTIIGNKNSLVYHAPSCNSLPSENNRVYFKSAAEAQQAGMHPHKECVGK